MRQSPIIRQILTARGITDIEQFCNPSYESLSDPSTMYGMEDAIERIHSAFENNEKITIYSDYDADGIPGAVILTDFFKLLKYENYSVYIPHRHDEGYGLHLEAIEHLASTGTQLMITCDLGITARDEIEYAKSLDMEVIVTDHHTPDTDSMPDCLIVHPKLGEYADPMLCGCAVAFQLIRGMIDFYRAIDPEKVDHIPDGYEKWLLDLVGLSTISDMVPLLNENRIFAKFGLKVLQQTRRPGLRALALLSRTNLLTADETTVGFRITPYINAASRMDHPMLAYDLISASTQEEAIAIARKLNSLNTLRRSVVDEMIKTARQLAEAQSTQSVLWIGEESWHVGVLSIIAGRISEEYKKPVFVWTKQDDELLKGSARGHNGFNILETMMDAPGHIFKKRGGHSAAGGFSLYTKHSEDFVQYLADILIDESGTVDENDALITGIELKDINLALTTELDVLRPFGMGNPEPVFRITGRLIERKVFGKTKSHEKLLISDDAGHECWLLLFSSEREQFTHWQLGEFKTILATIERSGEGRYLEVVMRPVKR